MTTYPSTWTAATLNTQILVFFRLTEFIEIREAKLLSVGNRLRF
jgi:hypothetical protein